MKNFIGTISLLLLGGIIGIGCFMAMINAVSEAVNEVLVSYDYSIVSVVEYEDREEAEVEIAVETMPEETTVLENQPVKKCIDSEYYDNLEYNSKTNNW